MPTDGRNLIQTLFTFLITLQFVVIVLHDLVDIPGWTQGSQVESIIGRGKLWDGDTGECHLPRRGRRIRYPLLGQT
jgi:hypothetical protein